MFLARAACVPLLCPAAGAVVVALLAAGARPSSIHPRATPRGVLHLEWEAPFDQQQLTEAIGLTVDVQYLRAEFEWFQEQREHSRVHKMFDLLKSWSESPEFLQEFNETQKSVRRNGACLPLLKALITTVEMDTHGI